MKKKLISIFVLVSVALPACKKKEETTPTTNIATSVVANLNTISATYAPSSLASNSVAMVEPYANLCDGVDFAVCQSKLIREYLKIGKNMVDLVATLANSVGGALGQVADGSAGTSSDGQVSWSRTDASTWAILVRGTAGASSAHFSIAGGVYSLKVNQLVDQTNPTNVQVESTVSYTDADTWSVDVLFINGECAASDPSAPSKVQIRLSKASGLWTGKSMLYVPRWASPGSTKTCADTAGVSDIAMYTDFVGNDTSTKAALYMMPSATSAMTSVASHGISDFCTNFPSSCGGMNQPTAGALAAYPNNWCTSGPTVAPEWGNNCTSNAAVSGASFSNASNWVTPATLKAKTITLPTAL